MKTALSFNDVSYLNTALAILDGVFPAADFKVMADGHGVSLVLDLAEDEIAELKAEVAAVNNNVGQHVLTEEDASVLDAAYAPIVILHDEPLKESSTVCAQAGEEGGFSVWLTKQNFAGKTLAEQTGNKGAEPMSVRHFEMV